MAELTEANRDLYQKLNLWSMANVFNQNHGLNSLAVQRQFGSTAAPPSSPPGNDATPGGGVTAPVPGVDPNSIKKLMDTIPFGGSVSVNYFGLQPQAFQPVTPEMASPPQTQPEPPQPAETPQVATATAATPKPGLLSRVAPAGLAGLAGAGLTAAALWAGSGDDVPAPSATTTQQSANAPLHADLTIEIPLKKLKSSTSTSTTTTNSP